MRLRSLHCLGPECAVQQFSSTITDPLVLLVAVESLVFALTVVWLSVEPENPDECDSRINE